MRNRVAGLGDGLDEDVGGLLLAVGGEIGSEVHAGGADAVAGVAGGDGGGSAFGIALQGGDLREVELRRIGGRRRHG